MVSCKIDPDSNFSLGDSNYFKDLQGLAASLASRLPYAKIIGKFEFPKENWKILENNWNNLNFLRKNWNLGQIPIFL